MAAMGRHTAQKLASAALALFTICTVTFVATEVLPGDEANAMVGSEATPAQIAAARSAIDGEGGLVAQYVDWLAGVARFDLGESVFLRASVVDSLVGHSAPTILLATYGLAVALLVGVAAGSVAAARPGSRVDRSITLVTASVAATAEFVLGLLLILVFAVALGWFPSGGYVAPTEGLVQHARAMALPAVAVGLSSAALVAHHLRARLLDELGSDYVLAARARGLGRSRLVLHAGANSVVPVLTIVGIIAADLLGGALVVETVFGIPGIGQLTRNALARRDVAVVQGVVIYAAAVVLVCNIVVDLVSTAVDPRRRGAGA
jgi:peptide/nickel transport system permease protein